MTGMASLGSAPGCDHSCSWLSMLHRQILEGALTCPVRITHSAVIPIPFSLSRLPVFSYLYEAISNPIIPAVSSCVYVTVTAKLDGINNRKFYSKNFK